MEDWKGKILFGIENFGIERELIIDKILCGFMVHWFHGPLIDLSQTNLIRLQVIFELREKHLKRIFMEQHHCLLKVVSVINVRRLGGALVLDQKSVY